MKALFTILILVVLCGCQTTGNFFPQEKGIYESEINPNFNAPVVIYKQDF